MVDRSIYRLGFGLGVVPGSEARYPHPVAKEQKDECECECARENILSRGEQTDPSWLGGPGYSGGRSLSDTSIAEVQWLTGPSTRR